MRHALALTIALAVAGCAHPEPLRPRTAAQPEVRPLDVGTGTHAYVVMGERPILVDTGWGARTDKVIAALHAISVEPRDLALIVLTHGHGDHAGGAARLRELSGAKVLLGAGDVEMTQTGRDRPLKPTGFVGKLARGLSDKPFPAFLPDVAVSGDFDLRPFGVDGRVVPAPGHTPGSVVILLPRGEAIVGDLLRGSLIRTHAPERHFFHDDCRAAEAHIGELAQQGYRKLFVGHGGPVDAVAAAAKLHGQGCPN
jgi:glyoxylase-like metal-dependent hydrolase (beta-lactamase superfamily II)